MEVSALAIVGLLGLTATAYVALHTSLGLRLDRQAMYAVSSPAGTIDRLHEGLSWVSVGTVGLSLLGCVAIALMGRRPDLALGSAVLIGGANVTTQLIKHDLLAALDPSDKASHLPSGHTTVALSIALAAVIVVPSAWRSRVAIGASATATLVGVATVIGRWHQPADVIAAIFVCMLWAAIGLMAAALVRHRPPSPASREPAQVGVHAGALVGSSLVGGLLVSWGVHPQPGMRDLGLGVVSLGTIGLACAVSVGWVAYQAHRHLR